LLLFISFHPFNTLNPTPVFHSYSHLLCCLPISTVSTVDIYLFVPYILMSYNEAKFLTSAFGAFPYIPYNTLDKVDIVEYLLHWSTRN
jgi:hypothetical protein